MSDRSSGSGERALRMGLRFQDRASAKLAYDALLDGTLSFVALADDQAGMFDDVVIGRAGRVIAHQYKFSVKPIAKGVEGLLLGADQTISDCAKSFIKLETAFPGSRVTVRYVTSHFPSANDKGRFGIPGRDSADFIAEKSRHPEWSLADWRATIWAPLVEELLKASTVGETDFERFFSRFDIITGAPGLLDADLSVDDVARTQIKLFANAIGDLIGKDGRTRWSRRELLEELRWPDLSDQRFEHRFPVSAHVQTNERTEAELEAAITSNTSGYLCVLGSPGSGKSTLLERFVQPGLDRDVVRYLAFVPETALGQGRGEDANFLADLNAQLMGLGYQAARVNDASVEERRETFQKLLAQASARFGQGGRKTIVVVDGLDHVPREQTPASSFLRALPLPQSIPDGVLFILGSQRIDLTDIPPDVRDQASTVGRKIEMADLGEVAVAAMVASAGLAESVDAKSVHSVSGGHPLVTQYLLSLLAGADEGERAALLAGGFEYGGDLERVYRAAWRGATQSDGEAAKVLVTLGFVENRIEPELLATILSPKAVDRAFRSGHHLLSHSARGWAVFHNSFRLFLRRQTIELYGRPDPAFGAGAICRRLAGIARSAPPDSSQRWLAFRYLFLAGDRADAAAIATRRYFVKQFIDGRAGDEVANDVRDAFRCVDAATSPAQVFELMLAKDEVWRRQDALSTSQRIVAAQIAAHDLDAAAAQIGSSYSAGDEWRVIGALIGDGQIERARSLFDRQNPWMWHDDRAAGGDRAIDSWAGFAVTLLDREQIERRIAVPNLKGRDEPKSFYGTTREEYLAELRLALAKAELRRNSLLCVDEVADRHGVPSGSRILLHVHAAEARVVASEPNRAIECLREYEVAAGDSELHGSWHLHAASLALTCGDRALATRFFGRVERPDLCDLEHRSEEVAGATRHLVRHDVVAARLGIDPVPPALPGEMPFRAIQARAIRLGSMIGRLRLDVVVPNSEVVALIASVLAHMAETADDPGADVLLGYRVRKADEPLFEAVCEIARLVPEAIPAFAADFERRLNQPVCAFRGSLNLLRKFVEAVHWFDADAAAAARRLEGAQSQIDASRSPQEAIDGLAELAIGFGRIGMRARAHDLLREMRAMSLGSYLAAKKDGQYHLWTDVLEAANRAKPEGSPGRCFMMLRLIAGVDDSSANDQAARMSKTVLTETVASSEPAAWDAYDWAKSTGIWTWDALADAVARGIIRRRPDLCVSVAIVWTSLAVPYYDEVYNSLARLGQFLTDLVEAAPADQLIEVERIVIDGLARDARPIIRTRLMRRFRDALASRESLTPKTTAAVERWNAEPPIEDGLSSDEKVLPDYFQLATFDDVERAVVEERRRREAQTSVHYGNFVNPALGRRIARLALAQPWTQVEAFAGRNPQLVRDRPIRTAVTRAAINAGDIDFAKQLLSSDAKERDGWGGWGGRGRLEHHQARHLLGADDAFERARDDFIGDLAEGGYGTGSALWAMDEIFPLLYRQLDWAELWDRLAEQIEDYRDFRKVDPVPQSAGDPRTDLDLLARLFEDAATFGVSDPATQVADGLRALYRAGQADLFCRAVHRLLVSPGPPAQLGARLLLEAQGDGMVRNSFRSKVGSLAASEDVRVAMTGMTLSSVWHCQISPHGGQLPAAYTLQLPPPIAAGSSLRDEETLGPVLDDPAAWTEGFDSWLSTLSKYSEVPVANLRRRVAMLIGGWGGAERYGAKAAKALQRRLSPLGLLVPFTRPHIGACIRALHVILCELWRAHLLDQGEVDILLYRLTGGLKAPPAEADSSRPFDFKWPELSGETWRDDGGQAWVDDVGTQGTAVLSHVVGEWARLEIFEWNTLYTEERLTARCSVDDVDELDDAIAELPAAFWASGAIFAEPDTVSYESGLRNLRISFVGDRTQALMFDPHLARTLGWFQLDDDAFSFVDSSGLPMVTTSFWRDGWRQEMKHARSFRRAEGQRVELTDAGLTELRRLEELTPAIVSRWRVCEPRAPKARLAGRCRSDPAAPHAAVHPISG